MPNRSYIQLRDILSRLDNSEIVTIIDDAGTDYGTSTVKYWLIDSFQHNYDGLSGYESVLKVDITGTYTTIHISLL